MDEFPRWYLTALAVFGLYLFSGALFLAGRQSSDGGGH